MKAESRKQVELYVHESSTYSTVATELPNVESITEYERYSSFEKIIRIAAWVHPIYNERSSNFLYLYQPGITLPISLS